MERLLNEPRAALGKMLATGVGQLFSYASQAKFNACDSVENSRGA